MIDEHCAFYFVHDGRQGEGIRFAMAGEFSPH
jgi:hypothetical protein